MVMVTYLERDGGAPGDVSQSHGQEETDVNLVSQTPQLSGRLQTVNRDKTTEKCPMDCFQSSCIQNYNKEKIIKLL